MSRTFTRVVVFDERLYSGSGLVNKWATGVTDSMFLHTSGEVSKITRSGRLLAGLRAETHRVGVRQVQGKVESTAEHSLFVLAGTANQGRRYIYSDLGWMNKAEVDLMAERVGARFQPEDPTLAGLFMVIRDGGPKYHLRVHGQKSNNFLLKGYNATARSHRALKPMAPGLLRLR